MPRTCSISSATISDFRPRRVAFPPRARASQSIRASSTPRRRSTKSWRMRTRGARNGRRSSRSCSRRTSRRSRRRTSSTTTTCCCTGRTCWRSRALARDVGDRFDHVLVDEYQDTNRLQSSILLALKPDGTRPHRRRRRRAIDLFVPRRDGAEHSRLSTTLRARRARRDARAQLPIDAADPRRVQRGDRPGARTLHQESLDRSRIRPEAAARHDARRSRTGALRRRSRARRARERNGAEVAGSAVSKREPQRAARARARTTRHSVREVRRPASSWKPPTSRMCCPC